MEELKQVSATYQANIESLIKTDDTQMGSNLSREIDELKEKKKEITEELNKTHDKLLTARARLTEEEILEEDVEKHQEKIKEGFTQEFDILLQFLDKHLDTKT
jgi:DNA-binding transcriptional regulator GbsR (MarR family)